jgi:hypothetical protein
MPAPQAGGLYEFNCRRGGWFRRGHCVPVVSRRNGHSFFQTESTPNLRMPVPLTGESTMLRSRRRKSLEQFFAAIFPQAVSRGCGTLRRLRQVQGFSLVLGVFALAHDRAASRGAVRRDGVCTELFLGFLQFEVNKDDESLYLDLQRMASARESGIQIRISE